jgi:hypothetical protein
MKNTYALVLTTLSLVTAFGCGNTASQSPILPTAPLSEEQIAEVQNEDERVAMEESQGSILRSANQ